MSISNGGFRPPRELVEVYQREREMGRASKGLESWLRERAQGYGKWASERERPHCMVQIGTLMKPSDARR